MKLLPEKLMKNKNYKKNLSLFFVITFLIFILILFFVFLFKFIGKENNIKKYFILSPAQEIELDYDFAADVYFNDNLGESIFSKEIIKAIDMGRERIEIAVYAINDTNIKSALNRALNRGVDIKVLVCAKGKNIHDVFFSDFDEKIDRKDISFTSWQNDRTYLMHHKFIIIDRGLPNQTLFFGSYNFTHLQEKYDPSFLIKTSDSHFVRIFGEEFDRINKGVHGSKKKSEKINPFAARLKYSNGFIEIWFSPGSEESSVKNRMSELIKNTKLSIKMLTWLWTDRSLAFEILSKSNDVKISIITDEANLYQSSSVFKDVLRIDKTPNIEIISDEKRQFEMQAMGEDALNSFLHQHTMIFDDNLVLTGTNNWSSAGFLYNDESIIISDIPFLVTAFLDSFKINYSKNK